MTTFEKVATIAKTLNRMPVPYITAAGYTCTTFYTTRKFLENIVIKIGSDNTIERDYRSLEDSCWKELGFKYIAIYIDNLSNGRIAILGI